MKKILLMAATAATMIFASCTTSEEGVKPEAGMANVTISISGVKPATRAIDDQGATGQLTLSDGYIFVIDGADRVSYKEEIDFTLLADAGVETQTLDQPVSTDSRIYILGNIPSDVDVEDLTTLATIEDAVSAMTVNTNYIDAALANSDGTPAALANINAGTGGNAGTATCTIKLSPLYSRMELVKVVGDPLDHITGFTVKGVYVDDYYPSFNMFGTEKGTQWNQGTSKVFTTAVADGMSTVGNYVANDAATAGTFVAVPATDKVWANHVPSAGQPRFIIHLTDITYLGESAPGTYDVPSTVAGDRYLTVTSYNEMAATAEFERGKIYRIGAANGITFNLDDLGLTPNPAEVDVTVSVEVIDWVVENLTPNL